MSSIVETPYFPGVEKPGVPGVFKRRLRADEMEIEFSYWDGEYWYVGVNADQDPADALIEPFIKSHYQPGLWEDFEWCGVVPTEGIVAMTDDDGVIQAETSEPVAAPSNSGFNDFFSEGVVHDEPAEPTFDSFFEGAQ